MRMSSQEMARLLTRSLLKMRGQPLLKGSPHSNGVRLLQQSSIVIGGPEYAPHWKCVASLFS